MKEQYGSDENLSGDESSTSEEEDDIGELITPELDAQIMKTIALIRTKQNEVYDSKKEFFSQEEIEKAKEKWNLKQEKLKKEKPMKLKDYHRKVLLEEAGKESNESMSSSQGEHLTKSMTHFEEQAALKDDFKTAALLNNTTSNEEEDDNDDNFLVAVNRTEDELKKEEEEYRQFLLENMRSCTQAGESLKEWKEYQGKSHGNDPEEEFLMK